MNRPGLKEMLPVFWRIGILSFGGPAAQIALMHKTLVEEKGWLSEKAYLNALSFCMLLPGPEAMQLATYTGWRLKGVAGGLLAGLLFVLPGAAIMLSLAIIYALFGGAPALHSLFLGVKAAVLVIVFEALLRVARRGLSLKSHWVIAALAFVGLFFLSVPFPLIILAAGLYGLLASAKEDDGFHEVLVVDVSWRATTTTILIWLSLWIIPLLLLTPLTGLPVLGEIGLFFSKLAMVTFGGAYAVLAYMAQDAVQQQGWLSTAEMMDGLGLAETTPGPLILVTEFVGFMAGARSSGDLSIVMGVAAAFVTLWATFMPCFLWVFTGAPYIEWLTSKPRLRAALTAISAAVVGVILNLSLWFALHVLFGKVHKVETGPFALHAPDLASLDLLAAILAVIAGFLLLVARQSLLSVLAACALLSLAAGFVV